MPTIKLEEEMGIAKDSGTLGAAEQILDPEVETPVTISMTNIYTPEENPRVCRSSREIFLTKPD